jgi:xylulokinase
MYLGIDCGTQSTKALLIDEFGKVVGRGSSPHPLVERPSGAREQEPKWWIEALSASVMEAIQGSAASVRAIGVSGQQHGLVVLDANKEVIRPAKLWNDTETSPQNEEIIRLLGGREKYFEKFGIVPRTGYTVSKLLWLKEAEPENFAKVRHILLPHEYLNFWLTGEIRAEFGDASGTAFFDVRRREWAREVLDQIDGGTGQLYAALPPFIGPNEVVGKVRAEVATQFGLSRECVVSAGGGDNMMGAIGTGNVREGVVTVSLGTSSTVYSFSETPVLDPTGNVAAFCSSSGGFLPLVCTMNATNVVTSTTHLLGKTVSDIDAALDSTAPGSAGLIFLPFLNGERTPDLPHAQGSLHGISPNNFTPENLIRAIVEGVSFGVLNGLDLVLEGKRAEVILVIGGGARSQGWRQLLADASGAEIRVPREQESACLGAAIQAKVACSLLNGVKLTFAEVADEFVSIDETATLKPRPNLFAEYRGARELFRDQLQTIYSAPSLN